MFANLFNFFLFIFLFVCFNHLSEICNLYSLNLCLLLWTDLIFLFKCQMVNKCSGWSYISIFCFFIFCSSGSRHCVSFKGFSYNLVRVGLVVYSSDFLFFFYFLFKVTLDMKSGQSKILVLIIILKKIKSHISKIINYC